MTRKKLLPLLLLTALTLHATADTPTTTPTTPTTSPATAPAPGPNDPPPLTLTSPLGKPMTLKFHDEFNPVTDQDGTPYIDRSKWQTTFWQGSSQRSLFGNLEAEYYVDKDYSGDGKITPDQRINPFSFETPGILTISATKVPQNLWKHYYMGEQRCFASGLLISDKAFTFQYGYIEGRFKLPANRGAWPAFWILGDDPSRGKPNQAHAWPPEVDVFEFFGHRPTKHSAGIIGTKGEKLGWHFGYNEPGFDISQDFHTWGFEWDDTTCVWTFDHKEWARTATPKSMNRPFYLLVNLAVGGKWYSEEMTQRKTPHKPWEVDDSTMPWKMQVDYVRVYQADGQPNSHDNPALTQPATQPAPLPNK